MSIPHNGMQPTSLAAFAQAQHDINEQKVFAVIQTFGAEGCISDHVQERLGISNSVVPYSSVTGPYSILERKFYIERPGEKRMGHRFKRMQLVMYALSNEERLRRVEIAAERAKAQLTPEAFDAIKAWYVAHAALTRAQEVELALRDQVIALLFPGAPLGKSVFEFTNEERSKLTLIRGRVDSKLIPTSKKRRKIA